MIFPADFVKWLEVFNVDYGPTAGTGTVDPGLINEIAFYAANGDTVSGLTTAIDGFLVTDASGVPSIGNAVGADCSFNGVFVGHGEANITSNNVFGSNALGSASTTGTFNTAIGNTALRDLTTGTSNISIGASSLQKLTTGSSNLAVGTFAASSLTFGQKNIALGLSSLNSITTGSENVCIGVNSGRAEAPGGVLLTTGSANTLVGHDTSVNSASAQGTIALGREALGTASTGATSGDDGPGIAIGSASSKVGFRGDGTIYPSAGTSAGYVRVMWNGAQYKMLLLADA